MKSSSPPKFDASKAAADQSAQNAVNLDQQQAYNRPNTTDSYGNTVSWTQTGTDAQGNPTFTQTQTMGDEAKGYAGGLSALSQRYLTGANAMLDRNGNVAGGVGDMAKTYFDASTANTQRAQEQQRQALDLKLRNQGAFPGTPAYDQAMRGFENAASDALTSAYAQAQQQAHSLATQDWNTEMATLQGLTSPGLSYMGKAISGDRIAPQQVSVPNVDVAGLEKAQYQSEMDAWKAKQQQQAALMGGLASLGGTALGIPGVSSAIGGGLGRLGASVVGGEYLPWGRIARGSGQ